MITPHAASKSTDPSGTGDSTDRWGVLARLFAFLERERINYAVLGDSRKVLEARDGDVDIVVSPATLRLLPKLLVRFSVMVDARLVQSIRHESTAYFFVLAWQGPDHRTSLLQIDVCSDYRRNGRTLIGADILLHGAQRAELNGTTFRVPSAMSGLAYYLVKKIEKDELNAEHASMLREIAEGCSVDDSRQLVDELFGREGLAIIGPTLETGRWESLAPHLATLQKLLHARRPVSRASLAYEVRRRTHRIIRQTGFHVVVYGPDGVGKSAVIEGLREGLELAFWGTNYFHLRPRLGNRGAHGGAPTVDPHGLEPRSAVTSLLKLVYYAADYGIGYYSTIKPLLLRSRLVVFDRYYHDLLVDPRRYRYGGSLALARVVGWFVPRPNLYLFLDAPTEVIRARKTEVAEAETSRQLKEYRQLARTLRSSVVIDASHPLPIVVGESIDAVLDKMAERAERRYWLR
jgi:thymidylate kinase